MQRIFVMTLFGICVLAALVFLLNQLALEHFLYWTFWWYDIIMHFLGGVLIASIVIWTTLRLGHTSHISSRTRCAWTLGLVLAVGVGWEIFEYVNGFFIGEVNVAADTALDLIMDVVGGAIGWLVLARVFSAHETIETTSAPSV